MTVELQGNIHGVAANAGPTKRVVFLLGLSSQASLTVDQALELAAWIVAVADDPDHTRFDEILEAVWDT